MEQLTLAKSKLKVRIRCAQGLKFFSRMHCPLFCVPLCFFFFLRNLHDITFISLSLPFPLNSFPVLLNEISLDALTRRSYISGSSPRLPGRSRSLTEPPPGIGAGRGLGRRVAVGALEVELAAVGEEEAEVAEHPRGRPRALAPREEVAVGVGVARLLAGGYALDLRRSRQECHG